MWKVLFTDECEEEIKVMIKKKLISQDDMRVISIWIKQVKKHGPECLRIGGQRSNWNDHALDRKWSGYRSSSFSFSGRIIYKIENKKIVVKVVRVTPDHNYT